MCGGGGGGGREGLPVSVQGAGLTPVEEVVNPLLVAVVGLCLRQLVVVMREAKVDASSVDVERIAQNLRCHHLAAKIHM